MIPNINYEGHDWAVLSTWLTDDLVETYKKLANVATDEAETHRLRGRAQLLNLLLDFRNMAAADHPPL